MTETHRGAVLFDLFGVIALPQDDAGKGRLVRTAGVPNEPFWKAYWDLRRRYDRGDLDGYAYWKGVGERLGTEFDDAKIIELLKFDVESWRGVDSEMVDLVQGLAASGRTIGLLSNIPTELADRFENENRWLEAFGVLAFSCRINMAKPEAGAYLWCAERMGVDPRDILFTDDRLDNVEAARGVGMRGHVFTNAGTLRRLLGE